VIERKDEFVVGVHDVDHHAVIFGEARVVGDHELIGDVDRAAERRSVMAQCDGRRRDRRRGRFFFAARGSTARHERERGKAERNRPARETQIHGQLSLQIRPNN